MADDPTEFGAMQRAALMAWYLMEGRSFTLDEAAQALGLKSRGAARHVLDRLSVVMPVYVDAGRWQCLPEWVQDRRRAQAAALRRMPPGRTGGP